MCVIRKQEETGASQRTKIKICGLSRPEDIEAVNEVKPDYAGFVVEVPKSRRNVSVQQLRRLTALLDHGIVSVGVFVNAPVELIVGLLQDGVLAMAQLHGQEDASYVEAVKEQTDRPIVQAFSIRTQEDVQRAFASPADYILLDQGGGGTGRTFDWSLLERSKAVENKTPFFLAGGLGVDNLEEAFMEFTAKKLNREERPSIRKALSALKQKAAAKTQQRAKEKVRERGLER